MRLDELRILRRSFLDHRDHLEMQGNIFLTILSQLSKRVRRKKISQPLMTSFRRVKPAIYLDIAIAFDLLQGEIHSRFRLARLSPYQTSKALLDSRLLVQLHEFLLHTRISKRARMAHLHLRKWNAKVVDSLREENHAGHVFVERLHQMQAIARRR